MKEYLVEHGLKRLFSFMCAVCIMTVSSAGLAAEPEKTDDLNNTAYVSYVSGDTESYNMDILPDVRQLRSIRDGQNCILGSRGYEFGLAASFANGNTTGDEFEIEVDYFDEGSGMFRISYDAYDEVMGKGFQNQMRYTNLDDTVYLKNTNMWKTAKFTLDDAYFGTRVYEKWADFVLMCGDFASDGYKSLGTVPISAIRVKKIPNKNPIKIVGSTNVTGNAFEWFNDDKIITNLYQNQTADDVSLDVKYEAVSQKTGEVIWQKTDKIEIKAQEKTNVDINVGEIKTCDIFDFYTYLTSMDGSINQKKKSMVFSIVKTDPDGICDDFMYICAFPERVEPQDVEDADTMLALIKKGNFRGIRAGIAAWGDYESEKGVYVFTESQKNAYELLKKHGLRAFIGVEWNNSLYMDDPTQARTCVPKTQKELDGLSKYAEHMISDTKDIADGYYFWNEPANPKFDWRSNKEYGVYAKAAAVVRDAAHRVDPNIIVMGTEDTDFWDRDHIGYLHYIGQIENGLPKSVDALSMHPYSYEYPEDLLVEGNSWELIMDAWKKNGGDPNVDVYVTEAGGSYGNAKFPENTSRDVGAYNVRFATMLRANKTTKNYCIYQINDTGTFKTLNEDAFGLTGYAFNGYKQYGKSQNAHEQYLVITAYNYLMANSEPDGIYDTDYNTRIYKFKSKKFDKDLVVMNSVKGVEQVSMDLGTNEIELYDDYGNMTKLYSDSGVYNLTVSEIPTYIMGNFNKFDVSKDLKDGIKYDNLYVSLSQNDEFDVKITKDTDDDYDIKISGDTAYEVIKNDGFSGREATVRLKCSDEPNTEPYTEIFITDKSGRTISRAIVNAEVNENFTVEKLQMTLPNDTRLSNWQGTMHIKNHQISQAMSGTVKFSQPSQLANIGNIDIGYIPPGSTGIVKFNVSGIAQMGMYNAKYTVSLNNGISREIAGQIDMTVASYADKKPNIDGKADKGEWSNKTAMITDTLDMIGWIDNNSTWGGKNDLSAKSVIQWDEDNLYLMTQVTDDKFCQPYTGGDMWKGDCIQLGVFYGEETFNFNGEINTKFNELCIGQTPNGPEVYRTLSQKSGVYNKGYVEDCELAVKTDGGITTYELKIPWTVLLESNETPKVGEHIRYSFLVNDNDGTDTKQGGRRGYIRYADGIGSRKNVEQFTEMKLLKGENTK